MKTFLKVLFLAGCFLPCRVGAQISVEVIFDRDYYVANEPVIARVRISNQSGRTLTFGKEMDWLTFAVETGDHYVVKQIGNPQVQGQFSLDSSTVGTKKVDLAPYFEVTQPGRYGVIASVKVPQWDRVFTSRPQFFGISSGAKVWESEFGMPVAEGAAPSAPEVRKYVLQRVLTMNELKLYCRITDQTGAKTYHVLQLGPMVSFSDPQGVIDKWSNLHVLNQKNARSFFYCVLTPNGQLITRETYDYSDSRPVLKSTEEGRCQVVGGIRRISPTDLPPPERKAAVSVKLPIDDKNTPE